MDELTKINNRSALQVALEKMLEDCTGNTYCLAMADIDNFKRLNDTFGHNQGDICLKEFGSILKGYHTEEITPFRFGGDEFCILYKNKEMDAIIDRCNKIQQDFQEIEIIHQIDFPVTISFGIGQYETGMTISQFIEKTDSALYRSKTHKNMITISQD